MQTIQSITRKKNQSIQKEMMELADKDVKTAV